MAVENVVIIGSGPAGWSAAIYTARANLRPVVIQGHPLHEPNRIAGLQPLGQLALTTEVENFASWPAGDTREYLRTALDPVDVPYWVQDNKPQPTHGINGPELMALMRKQAANCGARIVSDDVVKIDLSKRPFTMHTRDGETYQAKAVIVATGARANYLGLPSEDKYKNYGVSACAVCDGALPRFKTKGIVVVGGGDSAVEEASYLTKFNENVYLVVRRDKLRASKVMQERAMSNPRIKLKWNRQLAEVLGSEDPADGGVTGAVLKSTVDDGTEKLDVSGVFLAIGHTPNTGFLEGQLELDEVGYIKYTKGFRTYTSVEGVFAAGDVADSYYRQAITAAGTGCMAALDAERWLAEQGEH